MADGPLVSIITPCYNAENTLGRLIESVLAQSYSNIEWILVNDGSTDGTDAVVMGYSEALESRLNSFTYIVQDNLGLGGAINTALQHVRGRYICWPDADDYLEIDSVAARVAVLEANPDFAVVTSDAYMRDAEEPTAAMRVSPWFRHNEEPWQFKHLLMAESIFTSGCHMACMRRFDETHPGRTIYPARRGQNWQMLLPLYYSYKRYFLDVPLYDYMVYPGSMSRSDTSLKGRLERAREHRDIVLRTLASMNMPDDDRVWSARLTHQTYARGVVRAGIEYSDPQTVRRGHRMLLAHGTATLRDWVRLLRYGGWYP